MLTMLLEILVVVIVAIGMVIPMLLWGELVHLLGACSKLVRASVTPHRHYKLSQQELIQNEVQESYSVQEVAGQTSEPRFHIADLGSFLGSWHT